MAKVFIYKGLPGSGKSTAAKQYIKKHPNTKRVNKDDLRNMLDNGAHSKPNEQFVLSVRDKIILDAVSKGHDIIVDDTNFEIKHERHIRELVGPNVEVEIVEFDTSIDECVKRDAQRPVGGGQVGEAVIRQIAGRREANKDKDGSFTHPAPWEPNDNLPVAVICDIDGTLAHMGDRSPYEWNKVDVDTLDQDIADLLTHLWREGIVIILLSGRDGSCTDMTKKWLENKDVVYTHLWMREAGDQRRDSIVKAELFDKHIRDDYDVWFVLDDRDQVVRMWRNMGLKVLQVEYGDF